MKKCPYCGKVVEDTATGCPKCHAGFPQNEPVEAEQASDESNESPRLTRKKNRS